MDIEKNTMIWLVIGFLTWLFLFIFDETKDKSYSDIIKELFFNTLFGPITTFFVIMGLILSKEFRSSILSKIMKL